MFTAVSYGAFHRRTRPTFTEVVQEARLIVSGTTLPATIKRDHKEIAIVHPGGSVVFTDPNTDRITGEGR